MLMEIIAYSGFLLILLVLIVLLIKTSVDNRNNKKIIDQLSNDVVDLRKSLKREQDRNSSNEAEKTEGFLKFVSESRDWAFQYIDKAQAAVKELQFSIAVGEQDRLDLAHKQLLDLLPDEEKDN